METLEELLEKVAALMREANAGKLELENKTPHSLVKLRVDIFDVGDTVTVSLANNFDDSGRKRAEVEITEIGVVGDGENEKTAFRGRIIKDAGISRYSAGEYVTFGYANLIDE